MSTETHTTEYVLTFETVDAFTADRLEMKLGRGVWKVVSFDDLEWDEVTRASEDEADIRDQFDTLTRWAETHEQPIRNVRLKEVEVTRKVGSS